MIATLIFLAAVAIVIYAIVKNAAKVEADVKVAEADVKADVAKVEADAKKL